MERPKKIFTIYFELFGKKMKTEVEADSIYAAQAKVKDKIIFHKYDERDAPMSEDDVMNAFNDLFGDILKKK
jgi:hypothetical protein